MKLNFIINNYLLVWNLLYGPSISIRTHAFKQKLWLTYKKEYKSLEQDKEKILMDIKNFIPDDNTLYDLIDGTTLYERLEKDATKLRLTLLKSWDSSRKEIEKSIYDITRLEYNDKYNVIVLPNYMNTIYAKNKNLIWGKKNNDDTDAITTILFNLLKDEFNNYQEELDKKIEEAILELAFRNELYVRIKKTSNYLTGNKELSELKKQIYPYFLMYLGIDLDDTVKYMMRDKVAFDVEKYTNEVQLRNLNLKEFIDFIVRNKTRILRIKKVGLEII